MKRSRSLRTQLTALMAILVALQSIALLVALLAANVFSRLDAESFRLFDNTAASRAENFNSDIGVLVSNTSVQAEYLADSLNKLARQNGVSPDEIYLHDELFEAAMEQATESVLGLIQSNNITGAFLFLNGSNAAKEDDASHSAVYIRNSSPNLTAGNYVNSYMVELGPTSITQNHKIPMSSRWSTSARFEPGEEPTLYTQPIWASEQHPYSEVLRYGYWANPTVLFGDGQEVLTYSLPMLDADGVAYGVFGFEISMQYFTQQFLPTTDLPYQNSFYVVANLRNSTLMLDWYIAGGTLAQVHLAETHFLTLEHTASQDLDTIYTTRLESLGDMYAAVHPLQLYSANSPFGNVNWALVAFVSKGTLHETSNSVRTVLFGSILATTIVAFIAVVLLPLFATRKIRGLSKKLRNVTGQDAISIPHTGLGEVDELIDSVEKLNRGVIAASERISKIIELTSMPIGGFEVQYDAKDVFATEYVHELLGLPPASRITREEWDGHFARLTARPEPGDPNVYEYTMPGGSMWLRIMVTDGDASRVGIVVDVTKDVEEHRRLSHELDFDSMTGLYSRYAFKRVAYSLVSMQPGSTGAMVFADLDNLKYINDNYGHDTGDIYLQTAGEMFGRFHRLGAVAARIAGDEFAIYMHGDGRSQEEIRRQLYDLLGDTKSYSFTTKDGKHHRIRFSAGIAWYPGDADSIAELLKLADYAMYEAKHYRKGTIVEFNQSSYKQNAFLLDNREAISRLIDEELIRFDLQPIVDLKTGCVFAYEALMRSQMKEFRSPLEILSVAGAQSKLYQLERLVVFKTFALAHEKSAELGGAKLFINSMPSQQLTRQDIEELVQRFPNAMQHIVVEVTEDEKSPMQMMADKISMVRAIGCKVAVDDFGAGYSNELRILSLDPDYVKIDMAIIQGISADEDKQHLVSSIVSFCQGKGIATIAEGVEDESDVAEVIRLGITYVQGYFSGRPAGELAPPQAEAVAVIQRLNEGKKSLSIKNAHL